MDENNEEQLQEYLSQLKSVDVALKLAQGDQLTDLLDLKNKLCEVISLLRNDNHETNNGKESKEEKSSMDDEFARFQMEINQLDNDDTTSSSEDESSEDSLDDSHQELSEIFSSLEGSKCRAPFSQPWGEKGYFNAVVINTEFNRDAVQGAEEFVVKVMFSNPICDKMKPCSFFLDGHCKFSDEMCRFSHGHEVFISDLQEFHLPDFSQLKVDAKCLAKGKDELWQLATVEKCLEEQKFVIKFDRTGKTVPLDVNDVLPIEDTSEQNSFEDDRCSYEGSSNQEVNLSRPEESHFKVPDFAQPLPSSTGEWEKHTKGIGSKLMEKMGHVWGQGLGKNSDGRLEPIEAVILPSGKSLDKCIEMRDNCNPKGPVALETRLEIEQDKEEQRAKTLKKVPPTVRRKNVFDFINSKISKINSDGPVRISKDQRNTSSKKSNQNLNVQLFNVGEDIKKARKELGRLKQSLARNTSKNETVSSQVQRKIEAQNDLVRRLQAKEQRLSEHLKLQSGCKKLTAF